MLTRRTFLKDLGNGVIFVASYPILQTYALHAAVLQPTPANTEGPFYLPGAPFRTNLREAGEPGVPLTVQGSLVDTSDRPISKGLIEVWHTDNSGHYDLRGFKHRASIHTSNDGKYGYETIMPSQYSGRPRHIHYKISAPAFETLVTQLYFENDPFFEGKIAETIDKDPLVQYRELIRPVVPYREGRGVSVIFKICLRAA